MRLYTCTGAPSPRRVTLYLAEKGIELDTVEVDLKSGEHLTDEFQAKSPECTVPVLELDDGTCLWNSIAIRQYVESLHPEPPLLGRDPLESARLTQYLMWIEHNGMIPAAEAFRNAAKGMKDHALPGPPAGAADRGAGGARDATLRLLSRRPRRAPVRPPIRHR